MTRERTITLYASDGVALEARYAPGTGHRAALITHPHPLHGGDMHHPVVAAIAAAYARKGYATLRFNFRGVGNSQGRHDNGHAEGLDVLAAAAFLRRHAIPPTAMAGYSFGAWILARLEPFPSGMHHVLLVSPPVALLPFPHNGRLPGLRAIVGDRDAIAPLQRVEKVMTRLGATEGPVIVEDADHLFTDRMAQLDASLDTAIA